MLRFQNRLKLVNREIETVVLNTLNLIDSKKWVIHGFLIFHEMGNPLGVYETNYKVKFVISSVILLYIISGIAILPQLLNIQKTR